MAGRQPRGAFFSGEASRTAQRFGDRCISFIYIFRVAIPSAIRKSDILPLRKRKYTNDGEALSDTKTDRTVRVLDRKGHSESRLPGEYARRKLCGARTTQQLPAYLLRKAPAACNRVRKQSPFRRAVTVPIRSPRPLRGMLPFPVAAVGVPLFETNVTFVQPKPEAVKKHTAGRRSVPTRWWRVIRLREQPAGVVAYRQNPVARDPPIRRPPHPFRLDYGLCFAGGYLQA